MSAAVSRLHPPFIIAEAAQGYEGKPLLGQLLIRAAAATGADAVKFQVVFADDVAVPAYCYYAWYRQLEMPSADWQQLRDEARQRNVAFATDLSGERALALVRPLKPDIVKIHSTNFFNHRLVADILRTFPRVLVSTGGIHVEEIEAFISRHRLVKHVGQVVFLFGFQAEPTPLDRNALARLPEFQRRLEGFEVGFMDHAEGDGPDVIHLSVMAQALGVRLFEKHLTLDRSLKLEDYVSALEPARFAQYVQTLRRLGAALGEPVLTLNEAERAYRLKTVKKLLPARDLPQGHVLAEADLVHKRLEADGDGCCCDPDAVIGRRLARPVSSGQPLRMEDVS